MLLPNKPSKQDTVLCRNDVIFQCRLVRVLGSVRIVWWLRSVIVTYVRGQVWLRLQCDGTRAETRFRLLAKRTSLFKSTVVQLTTGSRGVCISGSNAGYTMFRSWVKGTGYPLHSPVSLSLSSPVRHRVPSRFNWTLQQILRRACVHVARNAIEWRAGALQPGRSWHGSRHSKGFKHRVKKNIL